MAVEGPLNRYIVWRVTFVPRLSFRGLFFILRMSIDLLCCCAFILRSFCVAHSLYMINSREVGSRLHLLMYCSLFVLVGAENEEYITSRVNDRKHPNRIHNPNRLSSGTPKILWSSLRPWDIALEAKSETKVFLAQILQFSSYFHFVHKQLYLFRLL